MKKMLCCVFILVFLLTTMEVHLHAAAVAEREKPPATKLESFLVKKGKLIIKEFRKLGLMYGRNETKVILDALTIYEPGREGEKVQGLKIEISETKQYGSSDSAFLDFEEVESLSQAIQYMVELATKWKDTDRAYTEVIFSTKGDFQIGFYQQGNTQAAFLSSGYIGRVNCFLSSMRDLVGFKQKVDDGLKLLK